MALVSSSSMMTLFYFNNISSSYIVYLGHDMDELCLCSYYHKLLGLYGHELVIYP